MHLVKVFYFYWKLVFVAWLTTKFRNISLTNFQNFKSVIEMVREYYNVICAYDKHGID